MFSRPSTFATHADFWKAFVPGLTAMVGFWATLSLNIPDFTRFGRGQREQMLGQTLGLPTAMIGFSAMAVVITTASQTILTGSDPKTLWDPVVLLSQITSSTAPPGLDAPLLAGDGTRLVVAVLSLLGVAVATISTNIAANVISPANDFANCAPRLISFRTGGVITAPCTAPATPAEMPSPVPTPCRRGSGSPMTSTPSPPAGSGPAVRTRQRNPRSRC